jgi:hypothetical protein
MTVKGGRSRQKRTRHRQGPGGGTTGQDIGRGLEQVDYDRTWTRARRRHNYCKHDVTGPGAGKTGQEDVESGQEQVK